MAKKEKIKEEEIIDNDENITVDDEKIKEENNDTNENDTVDDEKTEDTSKTDKKAERKAKYEERREKSKAAADSVFNDLSQSIDEFKENVKNIQKAADQRYADYKKSTVQNLEVDLLESDDTYYVKAAVPGITKDEIAIEAGDNDITIEANIPAYAEEFDADEVKVISAHIKAGRCVKTVRFENSIDVENISAKFDKGAVYITIPKLIIPKHKVTVE